MKLKMLPSQNEYQKLINKSTSLSEEELKKIINFENYIVRSKKHEPYLTEENIKIVQNYDKEIAFLKSLQEKNNNQQEALARSQKITPIIPIEEQKEIDLEKTRQQEQKLELKKQTRAGYMGGAMLIYLTLNLGLFIVAIIIKILK